MAPGTVLFRIQNDKSKKKKNKKIKKNGKKKKKKTEKKIKKKKKKRKKWKKNGKKNGKKMEKKWRKALDYVILIDNFWFELVFECVWTEKRNFLNWKKIKIKMRAPPAHFFLFLNFFQIQNIYCFMFEHVQKVSKIEKYRLKSKRVWFGEEILHFFYHFPVGGVLIRLIGVVWTA